MKEQLKSAMEIAGDFKDFIKTNKTDHNAKSRDKTRSRKNSEVHKTDNQISFDAYLDYMLRLS